MEVADFGGTRWSGAALMGKHIVTIIRVQADAIRVSTLAAMVPLELVNCMPKRRQGITTTPVPLVKSVGYGHNGGNAAAPATREPAIVTVA